MKVKKKISVPSEELLFSGATNHRQTGSVVHWVFLSFFRGHKCHYVAFPWVLVFSIGMEGDVLIVKKKKSSSQTNLLYLVSLSQAHYILVFVLHDKNKIKF